MKNCFIYLGVIIIALLITGCSFSTSKNENIIKYEQKTSEYFEFLNNSSNSFYIDSQEELNNFHSLFSNELNVDENYLNTSTIFIQVKQVTSGSISMKLKDVNFNNNTVNFSIIENNPEFGTDDEACWYLVAIIPNNMLENVKFDGWIKPSEVAF